MNARPQTGHSQETTARMSDVTNAIKSVTLLVTVVQVVAIDVLGPALVHLGLDRLADATGLDLGHTRRAIAKITDEDPTKSLDGTVVIAGEASLGRQ